MIEPDATPPVEGGQTPFFERIRSLLAEAEESIPPLTVLVWGPAENQADPWWLKRLEIRDQLRHLGHEAYFSEELPGGAAPLGDARRLALRTVEMAHAMAADYIIVLMSSYGSVSEFHDFGDKPALAKKMLVFVDEAHQSGYAASLLQAFRGSNGRIELITVPRDLVECNIRTKALEAVDDLHQLKMFDALEGRGCG